MSDTINRNYELAFHISSNLDEADVQKTRQELEKMLVSNGGLISFAKDPEKVHLAYPIKHQSNAYFGYFNFSLESPEESVTKIKDEMRANSNVLRFLILKIESRPKMEKEDLVRKLAMAEKRRARMTKGADKPAGTKQEGPKVSDQELEEKLEEIIEKL